MWYQNIRSALFSLLTIHACDGQTDRQTDGRTDRRTELRRQYRALHYMQSHGKNGPIFTARAERGISCRIVKCVCLSVYPFVCHTRALWQNQTIHLRYFDATRKGNHPSYLTPTVVGGLKFALKVTQSFKTRRLRQICAYNISTVRDSENSWIMTNRESVFIFPLRLSNEL